MNEYATFIQDEGKWKECEFLTGEEMAQRATELLRENKRLNNRIDKAIEILEEYVHDGDIVRIGGIENYVLDILKGEKDERI